MMDLITKPADIVFIMHHDSWVSRVIAWFMQSKWSHSALIFYVGAYEVFTTETNELCVKHGTLSKYLDDPNCSLEIWSPNLSIEFRKSVAERSKYWIDSAFGWLQLISLGIRRLLMRIGIKIPNLIRQGMVCDHVILYSYGNTIDSFPEDKESIDTEELYQIVKNCGMFSKVYEKKKNEIVKT